MKKIAQISIYLLIANISFGQYYFRGEIVGEKNKLIPNCNIYIHSSRVIVSAGSSGSFGLMSTQKKVDTITIMADNYEKTTVAIALEKYNIIKLQLLASAVNIQKNKLVSATKDLVQQVQKNQIVSNETYSTLIENEFIDAAIYNNTGFSVNSDKASYSNIRRFIKMKSAIPTNAVRIDEMVNYFNLANTQTNDSTTFKLNTQLTQCPWNNNNYLLFANISAKKLNLDNLPPSNLVFLIDNSGSMELQNRMPLLKSAFKLLVKNLRQQDKISIITYGGFVNVVLEGLTGKNQDSILKVIEEMEPGGETPGESAIKIAYQKAKQYFVEKGNNRVIIATDGDFNVGIASEEELDKFITIQSHSGIRLTCLGLGMGNYKDSKLEVLAKKGNGNFAYIDNEAEGEKIMVQEMTQTLFSVADNTHINIEFNKNFIKRYRLLGFDNKLNAIADTSSILDGGQVGSGYSSIVLFEIEPTKNINEEKFDAILDEEIAVVNINYKNTTTQNDEKVKHSCKFNFMPLLSLPKPYGFAAAVAMFGSYVKVSKYLPKTIDLDAIISLTKKSLDANVFSQNEFLQLLELARPIYEPNKKHKKKNLTTVLN